MANSKKVLAGYCKRGGFPEPEYWSWPRFNDPSIWDSQVNVNIRGQTITAQSDNGFDKIYKAENDAASKMLNYLSTFDVNTPSYTLFNYGIYNPIIGKQLQMVKEEKEKCLYIIDIDSEYCPNLKIREDSYYAAFSTKENKKLVDYQDWSVCKERKFFHKKEFPNKILFISDQDNEDISSFISSTLFVFSKLINRKNLKNICIISSKNTEFLKFSVHNFLRWKKKKIEVGVYESSLCVI
jgi:hypothetical protein